MAESKTVNVARDGPSPPPYTEQAAGTAIQSQPGYSSQPAHPGIPAEGGYPPQMPQQPGPSPAAAQPGYYPQTVQPVQQTSTVIMQPGLNTTQAIIVPAAPRPSSYLCLSIFACLFCNCVLGMCAIVYSTQVNTAYDRGDYEGARRNSNIAMWINIISILLGIGLIVYVIISVMAVV